MDSTAGSYTTLKNIYNIGLLQMGFDNVVYIHTTIKTKR